MSFYTSLLSTHPFVSDDLIGFLLQLVETQSTNWVWIFQGFGFLTGCCGTSGGTCGSDVIKVQVLVTGQVLLLQGLVQHVWMVPDLKNNRSAELKTLSQGDNPCFFFF